MHRFLKLEWDAIAGILAAVAALVLHFVHVIETDVLTMITLVLIALMFIRLLRHAPRDEQMSACVHRSEQLLGELARNATAPDAIVVKRRALRAATEDFARRAQGDLVWFKLAPPVRTDGRSP